VTSSDSGMTALHLATGLAYVCDQLAYLRRTLGDDGSDPSTPLAQLTAALESAAPRASQADLAGLLAKVHQAVREKGDSLGAYGPGTVRGTTSSGMEALQIVFRCPLRQCLGKPADRVSGPEPVCAISQKPLIRERL
jgi:hypothetical protein